MSCYVQPIRVKSFVSSASKRSEDAHKCLAVNQNKALSELMSLSETAKQAINMQKSPSEGSEGVLTSFPLLWIQLSPAVCSNAEPPTVLGFGSETAQFSLALLGSIMEQIAASNVPSADLQNTFLPFCSPSPYNRLIHASQTPTGDTVIILATASQGAI